jgi:mono/diheme cytochrome c family protein
VNGTPTTGWNALGRTACLLLGLGALSPAGAEAPQESPAPAGPSESVARFFGQYCVRCHGPEKQKGKLTLHNVGDDPASKTHARTWQAVLEKLEGKEMPPEDQPLPPPELRQRVASWIRSRLKEAGESSPPSTLLYPEKGNLVDHRALFSAKGAAASPAGPARLWRANPFIYQNWLSALTPFRNSFFGAGGGSAARRGGPFIFPWDLRRDRGFRDYAALYEVGEPETELLVYNARIAAAHIVEGGSRSGVSTDFRAFLFAGDAPARPQVEAAVGEAFQKLLRRAPDREELNRYADFLLQSLKGSKGKEALTETVAAVLLHPEAVFRTELGAGAPDAAGRVLLSDREIAFAIAYALTDRGPDGELLKAAQAGALRTREAAARHAKRILEDAAVEKPRILRFFQEYFGYTAAGDVFKDDDTVRQAGLGKAYHNRSGRPAVLSGDTDELIQHVLKQDRNVLFELLTTRKTFVNPKVQPHLTQTLLHYNLDPKAPARNLPLDLPEDQRLGVLTQPSWLIAHSTNFDNDVVRRGKWVRERLLGGTVPDLPITVDAKLPDEPGKSLRERMQVTRQPYCWQCHQKMDPLGLPFEMFDHFGRYRTAELGKPVDATGVVEGSGDPKLDGPVRNALDLIRKLAASEHVEQVFVRHAFRYWMGRNETLEDAATLIEAHRAYRSSGGSMKALIVSLLASDSFLYRVPVRAEGKPR